MALSVRRYQPQDRNGFARVRSLVYRGGKPVGPEENLLRADCHAYVIESETEMVGSAIALEMTCSKGNELLRMGGVASVGVIPNLRRGGAGSELMRGCTRLMKEDGFEIASLYAFRETYYRRFGYEICGGRVLISCPTHRLPKVGSSLDIRMTGPGHISELQGVMDAMGRRYAGFNARRTPDQWWRTSGGDTPMAFYVAGDPVEAFAVIRLRDDFWGEIEVRELAWSSAEGYRAMLQLFSQLAMNHDSIAWCEPMDSPFVYGYQDQGLQQSLNRLAMFRILDVEACLKKLNGSGSGFIGITDPDVPENTGTWDVAQAQRVDRPADVQLTIQEFTQVYLGEPSLRSICFQTGQDCPPGLAAAFASQPVYCSDFF